MTPSGPTLGVHPLVDTPKKFHLDKRAHAIAARIAELPDDALLGPKETSEWLGVCEDWLAIGRHRGYGPCFVRLSPSLIRYRIADVRAWLEERVHHRTAEYTAGAGFSDQHRANMRAAHARRRLGGEAVA